MKVICPECNFTSEIPEEKIPDNAQLATCPRCQMKFRFRIVEDEINENMDDTGPDSEQQYDSYEQTNIVHDNSEDNETHQQAPIESTNIQQPQNGSDIWNSLDSMSPEEDTVHTEETADIEQVADNEIPFEVIEKYGFFPAFFLTVKKIILSPTTFFKNMELNGYIKPFLFLLTLMIFQGICSYIWTVAGAPSNLGSQMGQVVDPSLTINLGTTALLLVAIYPLLGSLAFFPLIAITHLLLMIFGAGERGFQATYRAAVYTYAPIILCIIPVIGYAVGSLASFVFSIVAYKTIHNTSYMRVVLSIVIPAVLLLTILGMYSGLSQPTI
ncbi:zinc-ribbon domain-containing protein [Desulfovibrio sp. UCD-KL4C]|uniref:zinc-ribbon domain-containing protein n=1 Tax=Desulfovibrio sp. UCD-KL4C TaxID=2578120 RepID=UPI0025C5F244|nr:zinc-ribbon domain-containing protein [Desulfovibrio sp. UCD-KL4C]